MKKLSFVKSLAKKYSTAARHKRAKIFRQSFDLNKDTKILDLGSETGSNINQVLAGLDVDPANVYIADINSEAVNVGHQKYGYVPVVIDESKQLPFDENHFDIVYCSSVIEHVTVSKDDVWSLYSGSEFKKASLKHQRNFADDIKRVGKQYFVQTPYKYFPIESHSWLPFVGWLPRFLIISTIKFTNMFWVKKTSPDWYLLNKEELSSMFEGAEIVCEKSAGMTKSIMAIKSDRGDA